MSAAIQAASFIIIVISDMNKHRVSGNVFIAIRPLESVYLRNFT